MSDLRVKNKFVMDNSEAENWACNCGSLEVFNWYLLNYHKKQTEIDLYNACVNEKYGVISFLCNNFGFTIEDTDNFINEIPKNKREKIYNCLTPLGSYTKKV
jgi:hypothetical protein